MNARTETEPEQLLLDAQAQAGLIDALEGCLPRHALLWHQEDTVPYECDGLTAYRQRPLAVALPETYAQVQAVLQVCHAHDVPVVARGDRKSVV